VYIGSKSSIVADKKGVIAGGIYSFPIVVEMMQYPKLHSIPETVFAVSQCSRITESSMR